MYSSFFMDVAKDCVFRPKSPWHFFYGVSLFIRHSPPGRAVIRFFIVAYHLAAIFFIRARCRIFCLYLKARILVKTAAARAAARRAGDQAALAPGGSV